MKVFVVFGAVLVSVLLGLSTSNNLRKVSAQDGKKLLEIITLGTDAKLGTIKFSHIDHTTKNRSIEGSKMACIECHHVAQPAADAAKHPPLKTAWPADRTTTLTAELFEKDPSAASVAACRDCHARADTKPKLLSEIPQIKLEVGTELITLSNQQAFHRNCAGCHGEIVKTSKDLNPPTSKKCTACHKRTAA
jgi:cytochrome c553